MIEKKIYELKINTQFKQLIPPLNEKEFEQLELNIKKDGCREPICVWGNIIVDGHNRYEICVKNNIPFFIQEIEFSNKDEIIVWICANQLGRRNISDETKKYLIGKRYETERKLLGKLTGRNPYTKIYKQNSELKEARSKNHRPLAAIKLAKEYNISSQTILSYANYAKSIDKLEKKEPELISEVLKGNLKISQGQLINLSKQEKSQNNIKNYIKNKCNPNKINTKIAHKVTIKDMPSYDPDATINSLSFTIPSWIGSIDRVLEKEDFINVSANAKQKLKEGLEKLKFTADTILLAMEENNDGI
jgi:hypothetical protein